MTADESSSIEKLFAERVPEMYIADGHHRTAASHRVYQLRKEALEKQGKSVTGEEDFCFMMALLFPSSQLKIWDYNRVLRDLNGKSPERVLFELLENFIVTRLDDQRDPRPKSKGHFSLLLDGIWYDLAIKQHLVDNSNPIKSLDVEILTNYCLTPIFGK
eukprot:TRINITY_DN4900_c0_g1_i2.p1 TRINITY_DN4900_c0_g1~~TRINITY_DN4900_c0_g1_i2.p1  ORF type:complete len:160 (-),score=42.19 TRINITY_DN4900_c0_g1_i2:23-502(-)